MTIPKRPLIAAAILAGLLASAAPAHAGTLLENPGKRSGAVESSSQTHMMSAASEFEASKSEVSIETLEIATEALARPSAFA